MSAAGAARAGVLIVRVALSAVRASAAETLTATAPEVAR
jgi:hypothetical protein